MTIEDKLKGIVGSGLKKEEKMGLAELNRLLEYPDYDEIPIGPEEFLTSDEYLGVEKEVWAGVKQDVIDFFNSGVSEGIICSGIGAGKSYFTSLAFAYLAYRLLCFKSPQTHLKLARGSTIMLLNMGKTGMQSKKVVFHEISNRIKYSKWFRSKYPPDERIRSELRFPKDIVIFPGNAKETFPLGYNLYGGIIDEASWHMEASERDTAENIYNAMKKRIVSRAGGFLLIISSPRYANDFTEKKMKEAEKFPDRIFSRRRAIWDVKPGDLVAIANGDYFLHKNPQTNKILKIPNKYKPDFDSNPDLALRDYGAVASKTTEIYFKDEHKVKQAFKDKINPVKKNRIDYNLFNIEKVKYYVHIDLGVKVDAAGITMCHREGNKVVLDFILRLNPKEIGEIDFEDVRKIFFELDEKGADLGMVSYDSWQSEDSKQQFEKKGIPIRILSIDRGTGPYDTLKSMIYQNRLVGVRDKQAVIELLTLEMFRGRKIDHPREGSKDLADAIAGAVYNCVEFEFGEEPTTLEEKEQELLQKGEMIEPHTKEAELRKELEDVWWK